jgi:phosphoribosylanthranilate isomerase
MQPRVKVCGICRIEDAVAAAAAGADAIGINFFAGSPRCVPRPAARAIAEAVRGRVVVVGVFVDAGFDEIAAVRAEVGLDRVQLHGDEPPELLRRLGGVAYKAVRLRSREDLARLASYPGPEVLIDAFVAGVHGGTGARIETSLAREAARAGRVWLAGGLTPENVALAVREVRPYGVDVSSGVERSPGVKDAEKIAAFVRSARTA